MDWHALGICSAVLKPPQEIVTPSAKPRMRRADWDYFYLYIKEPSRRAWGLPK